MTPHVAPLTKLVLGEAKTRFGAKRCRVSGSVCRIVPNVQIEPGAQARTVRIVGPDDTAIALGTGDVPVLASSRVFAFCEAATFEALAPSVPAGSTSVAMRVHIDHIRAVGLGCEVTAIATLERVEGRRYLFVVSLLDPMGEVAASGRITRVLVDIDSFMAKACCA